VKVQFSRHGMYALVGATALALALPGLPAAAAHRAAGTPRWLVVTGPRRVTLTLTAAYTSAAGGLNFNGDARGKMVVSVPVGYTVNVIFTNKSAVPHSAVITAYSKRSSASGFTPVFHGAESNNPTRGITRGTTQRFSFVANKVGTYAIVCAVPGHAIVGMWDVFKVTPSSKPGISPGIKV
jgi:plastocyanin